MKVAASLLEADVGSIRGHTAPSPALMETGGSYVRKEGRTVLLDVAVSLERLGRDHGEREYTEMFQKLAAREAPCGAAG